MPPVTLPTLAALAVDTAVRLGVTDWVIAPGSRSAPLTAALAARSDVRRTVVYDERSAGYVALGIAQQRRAPVGLVCTSGTAAVNFGPAVVEAFYQGIPLLVLTADRPPEWIDQEDNQAIRQGALYGAHVKASFALSLDDGHPDTRWFAARLIGDALEIATALPPGPVHVNVPLREPLYTPAPNPPARPEALARRLHAAPALDEASWETLLAEWRASTRTLIVGGLHRADPVLDAALAALAALSQVALAGDVTSNVHRVPASIGGWETVLGSRDEQTLARLAPELVITFGGQVTSRALKAMLRRTPPRALWRISPVRPAPDTFQALGTAIPLPAAGFFPQLLARAGALPPDAAIHGATYRAEWAREQQRFAAENLPFLETAPFGEFAAARAVLAALPPGSALQLGNSMPIRYANLVGVAAGLAEVNGNRGTSGIDGTVSTAVGAALARPDRITTLIVGDLGFFYDRNGLWQRHLPPNLRIVLLNNHGGGIFGLIDGPGALPPDVLRDYFLTPQPLSARRTAEDHGLDYLCAADAAALGAALDGFFAERPRPAILEIETEMAANAAVYQAYKEWAAQRNLR